MLYNACNMYIVYIPGQPGLYGKDTSVQYDSDNITLKPQKKQNKIRTTAFGALTDV